MKKSHVVELLGGWVGSVWKSGRQQENVHIDIEVLGSKITCPHSHVYNSLPRTTK